MTSFQYITFFLSEFKRRDGERSFFSLPPTHLCRRDTCRDPPFHHSPSSIVAIRRPEPRAPPKKMQFSSRARRWSYVNETRLKSTARVLFASSRRKWTGNVGRETDSATGFASVAYPRPQHPFRPSAVSIGVARGLGPPRFPRTTPRITRTAHRSARKVCIFSNASHFTIPNKQNSIFKLWTGFVVCEQIVQFSVIYFLLITHNRW